MKKIILIKHLAKIFEKKTISESDTFAKLDFDSLIGLDLTTFNDEFFPDLKIEYENIENCKTIKDLIKLYGNKIS
jgi:acyl carrier protein